MPLELRPAAPADADAVRCLMAETIAMSVGGDAAEHAGMAANVNGNVALWLAEPARCVHVVVADEASAIVGVVLVKDFWNLCSLFVAPAWQGRELGRSLMAAAVEACCGRSPKQAIWLNATPDAIPFYRGLGFSPRESTQALPPGFMPMRLPLVQGDPEAPGAPSVPQL